ncbi:NUDIX hydrolase [Nocardiopsis dassonvillei]|uniref:NUDIX hydrolase n=1 Tax=Nocardiopsis dassonvillei TaxID=2014 RepID=UPI00200FFCAA|nr:NUDIX hydrolase [Nocardiopsis dassonvillei]MCK9870301.1 NUDIX hydrolase [Nocardiopsis dassonvillei]
MRDDKGLDEEVVYAWHPNLLPPAGMRIGQVYGYVFDDLGRVVVHYDQGPGAWNLPGGSPEPEDGGDPVVTLRREVWEEVQITITEPVYIGYQSVHRPGAEPYAQLRMVARLDQVGAREVDPAAGRVHVRRRCPFPVAVDLLGWGAAAVPQLNSALQAAAGLGVPVDEAAQTCTD